MIEAAVGVIAIIEWPPIKLKLYMLIWSCGDDALLMMRASEHLPDHDVRVSVASSAKAEMTVYRHCQRDDSYLFSSSITE